MTSTADWPAARSHPHTYPGACPAGPFAVVDDAVHPMRMRVEGDIGTLEVGTGDGWCGVDRLLAERGLTPVAERVPVIAYGGNRSPGTLALKRQHYAYRSTGEGDVFLALKASLPGVDAVAGGLSDQGYLYADLYIGPEVADTEIDVWVLLLDRDGVRMLHDSEGVEVGAYACARFDGLTIDGWGAPVSAFGYAGGLPVFVSPETGTPLAFEAVAARGRVLPAHRPVAMLDHAIASLGLGDRVRALTGIGDHPHVGEQAMKFLNGQFWYRRHTADRRVESCEQLEQVIWEGLLGSSHPTTTAGVMGERGAILDNAVAYDLPDDYTVGRWW